MSLGGYIATGSRVLLDQSFSVFSFQTRFDFHSQSFTSSPLLTLQLFVDGLLCECRQQHSTMSSYQPNTMTNTLSLNVMNIGDCYMPAQIYFSLSYHWWTKCYQICDMKVHIPVSKYAARPKPQLPESPLDAS